MDFSRNFFYFFIFLLLLSSCRDDEDEQAPFIQWNFPAEDKKFSVVEEIFVEADISDDRIIEDVEIGLFSKPSLQAVSAIKTFQPQSKTFTLSLNIRVSDSLLESGTYFLRIIANDGENQKAVFRDVKITAIPRKKLGVLLSSENQNTTNLYLMDDALNVSLINAFSASYFQSKVNSIDQHYWLMSKNENKLMTFQLKENILEFERRFNSSFQQLFSDSDLDGRTLFVSKKDGEILGFDERFAQAFNYRSSKPGRRVNQLKAGERFVLADETDNNGGNRSLQIIFRSGGFLRAEAFTANASVGFYFLEQDRAIAFQNDKQAGVISEVFLEEGSIRKLINLQDSIIDLIQIDQHNYLIRTKSKVLRYDLSRNTVLDYIQTPATILQYDDLNRLIYVAEGRSLSIYTYPIKQLVNQKMMPFEISGIDMWYNR